jgi:hypothetical protein
MVIVEAGIPCWLVNHVRDDTGTLGDLNMPVTGIQSPETTGVYTRMACLTFTWCGI